MLLSFLATVVVVAVGLFLLFRNKTREGNSEMEDESIYSTYDLTRAKRDLRDDITYKNSWEEWSKHKIQKLLNKYIIIKEGDKYSIVWKDDKGIVSRFDKNYDSFGEANDATQKNPFVPGKLLILDNVDVGRSFKCKKDTMPVGQPYPPSTNAVYRGELEDKLKHYTTTDAARLHGGRGYVRQWDSHHKKRHNHIETIDCTTKEYDGKLGCDETGKGGDYRGCKNRTRKGTLCFPWDIGSTRMGRGGSREYIKDLFNTPGAAEEDGLVWGTGKYKMPNNFCRTPKENDKDGREKRPWCYAHKRKEKKGWGYCDESTWPVD